MDEKVVAVISSVAIVNLLLASIVCWFNSFRHRYYFWLGWLIFSAAFAMINNLHIYLGYGNIWIYHISLLLNVSYGAYLVFFIRNHRLQSNYKTYKNILLFLPSILYVPFIILCIFRPEWASRTIEFSENGKMTFFGLFFNMIIVFYSVGTNIWFLFKELRERTMDINRCYRNQRIEILAVMAILQLFAFVPFVLKLDISYVILYMPVFGQCYYIYLFLRLWKFDRVNTRTEANIKTAENPLKYATIKLSDERLQCIKNQINDIMNSEKLYLIPEFSLSDLSLKTGIASNILSMVINSQMNTNFPDLVNKYRVDKAKELLLVMKQKNQTIETVAYDCGFSNRTSFYSAFRKFTSSSPSDFLKEMEKGNLSVG